MRLDDLDPVETVMGKPVTAMTATELVTYVRLAVVYHHDIELAIDGIRERSVMQGLRNTYGTDAGRLVKWACWHHKARDNHGRPLTIFSFAKGRKWWLDQLHIELQQHERTQRSQGGAERRAAEGFARLGQA